MFFVIGHTDENEMDWRSILYETDTQRDAVNAFYDGFKEERLISSIGMMPDFIEMNATALLEIYLDYRDAQNNDVEFNDAEKLYIRRLNDHVLNCLDYAVDNYVR